jgi:hypothetical protein
VLKPELAAVVGAERFLTEIRTTANLQHPHILPLFDSGQADGMLFYVMPYVEGESLRERLDRERQLPVDEAVRIATNVAEALDYAHAQGVIHRDIKPANILLESPVDRVKLTDFGLARAAEDVKLTRTGFVAGSPLYMAPEQARGDEVDHRADLFSLGSVLYEAATGTPAFDGKTPLVVLRRVADETPEPLHRVNADVPEWLSEIVNRLLAKNPADRYQSASEVAEVFAAELARWHALSPLDVPVDVCAGSSGSRLTTMRARRQICWKGVAFRVLPWAGGAVLGALALWLFWTPGVVENRVEVPVSTPVGATGPVPQVVYNGDSGAIWAITFLDEDRIVVGMEDGDVKIWNFRTNSIQKTLEPRQGGTIWSVDVSADGKYLVTPCDDSKVTVWNLETYQDPLELPQPTSTKAAAFSPDGQRRLATGDRNATVRLWNLDAQIPIELFGHRGTVHALAYSADGSRLASAGSDGTAKVWDLRGVDWSSRNNDVKAINLGEHQGAVYGVTFCPGCKLIATTGWDGTVRLWDAATGVQRKMIKAHDGDAWSVSFGNGGKWVASAGQDGVKVWDTETGAEVFSYHGSRAFHVVRFAKNGTTLAAGGRDGTVKVWELLK